MEEAPLAKKSRSTAARASPVEWLTWARALTRRPAADGQFVPNLVFTGVGGCFTGRATGLDEVLHRFIAVGHLTHGTFGTEVEAVYTGSTTQHVVVTRHWASMNGEPVHGSQALLVTVDGDRICTISSFSRLGPRSAIWD